MTKVYVVTEGWYEDYAVYGVFSTNELAKAFIDDNVALRGLAGIEEWTVDNPEAEHD